METISEVCHSKEELVLPKKQGKTREIYVCRVCGILCGYGE
jgi:rubrerythrin